MGDTNIYTWQEFLHYEMTLLSLCIHGTKFMPFSS